MRGLSGLDGDRPASSVSRERVVCQLISIPMRHEIRRMMVMKMIVARCCWLSISLSVHHLILKVIEEVRCWASSWAYNNNNNNNYESIDQSLFFSHNFDKIMALRAFIFFYIYKGKFHPPAAIDPINVCLFVMDGWSMDRWWLVVMIGLCYKIVLKRMWIPQHSIICLAIRAEEAAS